MHDYTKFYTPDEVADRLVRLAEIKPEHRLLDPSCGNGQGIKAIRRVFQPIHAIHGMDINRDAIYRCYGWLWNEVPSDRVHEFVYLRCEDFLTASFHEQHYDRIIANPPFHDNLWFAHLTRMYTLLKPGGRIVCIVPKHFQGEWGFNKTDHPAVSSIIMLSMLVPGISKNLHAHKLDNWATNKDGSTTEIAIVVIDKPEEVQHG